MTCVNIDFSRISDVIVQTACAPKGLRTTNTFSCTATDMGLLGVLFLTACISSSIDFDIKAFCSGDLCNLLLYGDFRLNLYISHIILESIYVAFYQSNKMF